MTIERDADLERDNGGMETAVSTFDDDVSRLVRLAGPRAVVPEVVSRRVHAAVHARWREHVRAKRRRRLVMMTMMAAAAILAAVAIMTMSERRFRPRGGSPELAAARDPIAFLEHVTGGALWSSAGAPSTGAGHPSTASAQGTFQALTIGAAVSEHTWLDTRQAARAALRIPGVASIRLDRNTRVQIQSASVLLLDHGALYVDTGTGDRTPLEIRTGHGVVRHLGTRFEVQTAPDFTRVRVRDGRVVLVRDQDQREASAGTELAVGDARGVVRRDVPIYGPDWAWVEQSAPEFAIEGQSLEALLRWTARETGWTVRFASDRTARSVAGIRLHGSSTGLTPSETLEAVLPTCNLTVRLKDGTAWIEPLHRREEDR